MSQYVLRRLLIAVPSLLGISLVLFTVLALAPGDPFSELATNPNVPPEVALALRAKFGLDDPIYLRYLHWLSAMLHGDWGFSFVSRMNVDTLILQRLPTTLYVIGSAQLLALLIAIPVGVYAATRPYSLFDQIANTLAFIGFSLPTFFTGILFILIFSVKLDWLPFVYTTDIKATGIHWVLEQIRAVDHAGDGARPVPGCVDDPFRALGDAGRGPARLHHHRPRQGPRAGEGHRQACDAQCHDSGRHPDRAADARRVRRRHRHRADLSRSGYRLAPDLLHSLQRHPGRDGRDLCVRVSRGVVQSDRGCAVWLA
jgi:Binding-prot-dependent transport system membrane comp, N-term